MSHASTIVDMMVKHNHAYKIVKVPAKNINTLLTELGLTCIDYLFIDVEGLDIELVTSINFDMFNIKQLRFEILHADVSKNDTSLSKCIDKLIANNYSITQYDDLDIIFTKNL